MRVDLPGAVPLSWPPCEWGTIRPEGPLADSSAFGDLIMKVNVSRPNCWFECNDMGGCTSFLPLAYPGRGIRYPRRSDADRKSVV